MFRVANVLLLLLLVLCNYYAESAAESTELDDSVVIEGKNKNFL